MVGKPRVVAADQGDVDGHLDPVLPAVVHQMRNSRQSWWGQVRSSCPRPTTWPNSMRYLLPPDLGGRTVARDSSPRPRPQQRLRPPGSRGGRRGRWRTGRPRSGSRSRRADTTGPRATKRIRRGGGRSSTYCAVSATEHDRTGSGRAAPADRRPQTTNADQSRGAEVEIQPTARTPPPARPGRSGVRSDPEQDPVTIRLFLAFRA